MTFRLATKELVGELGTGVAVDGTLVAVGGTDVAVGETGVADGLGVNVALGAGEAVAVGCRRMRVELCNGDEAGPYAG